MAPPPCCEHLRDGGARGAQRREEVHLHRPGEFVVGGGEEAVEADAHAADVVDENVDAAVGFDGAAHQLGRRFGCRQVERDGGDAGDALERRHAPRAGDDLDPLVDERARDGQADALAGAGDDSDLPFELQIHAASLGRARDAAIAAGGNEGPPLGGALYG